MLRHDENVLLLCCLLIFIVSTQNVPAQPQIAQEAYAIFEQSCLNCHGPDGTFRDDLLIKHDALIAERAVVPRSPDESELYNRLITPDEALRMPLEQPRLLDPEIETIKRWILAGAPDWEVAPPTNRRFIYPSEILGAIETHLMDLEPFNRPFARYFTMTHLYNAGTADRVLKAYRNGPLQINQ